MTFFIIHEVEEPQTMSRRFSCVDAQLFQKYPNAFVKSDFLVSYSLQKYDLFYSIAKLVKKNIDLATEYMFDSQIECFGLAVATV
jgi:3-oxoacyl-[acyl-carrier-protein] synthase III